MEESDCGLSCLSVRTNEVRQLSTCLLYIFGHFYEVKCLMLVFYPLFLLVDYSVLIWPSPLYIMVLSARKKLWNKHDIHT